MISLEYIEAQYTKRKDEVEKRAQEILYGVKEDSPNVPQELEGIIHAQFEDDILPKETIPLIINSQEAVIYRYVGEPPEPKLPTPKPEYNEEKKEKGFSAEKHTGFMIVAQELGLLTINKDGVIQRPGGELVNGVFRRIK